MATGKFSRRITVNRASTSDELKAYLISLDYGQQLTQSFIHTKTLANNVFVLTVGLDVQEVYTPRYTRSAVMKKPTAQVSLPFSLLSLMCTQDNYLPNGSHAGRGTRTGNRSHMFAGIPARNLNRGLRIRIGARARGTPPKPAVLRHFRGTETLRRTPVRCTGRIIRPGGKPIPSMNGCDGRDGEPPTYPSIPNAAA